jgi:hypothetical protein
MSLQHKGRLALTLAAATTAAVGMAAPAANAAVGPHLTKPDINRVSCLFSGDALIVYQSSYHNSDCFENAGHENVTIYNVDDVYTGNNGVKFTDDGWSCTDPHKNTWASQYCYVPTGTMTFLSIYPGS